MTTAYNIRNAEIFVTLREIIFKIFAVWEMLLKEIETNNTTSKGGPLNYEIKHHFEH